MVKEKQSFADKCIKDNHGKVVLSQAPNWSLIGWLVSKIIGYIHLPAQFHNGFIFLETAFLFTWASLELTNGVNYFRRALGLVVITAIVLSKFHS